MVLIKVHNSGTGTFSRVLLKILAETLWLKSGIAWPIDDVSYGI
jgi:hypothetical protein